STTGRIAGPPQHCRLCAVLRQGQSPAASRYQRLDKRLGQTFGGSEGTGQLPVLFFLSRRESEISISPPAAAAAAAHKNDFAPPAAGGGGGKKNESRHPGRRNES